MSEIPALQNVATIPGNVAIRHGEEVTCWFDFFPPLCPSLIS
ncbi:MAG: hypothetical protein V7709_17415 [Halioglobus sp.]